MQTWQEMDAAILDAIWTCVWQTGRPATLSIEGGMSDLHIIRIGDHAFDYFNEGDRLIAWAGALRSRKPNVPLPEPPQ